MWISLQRWKSSSWRSGRRSFLKRRIYRKSGWSSIRRMARSTYWNSFDRLRWWRSSDPLLSKGRISSPTGWGSPPTKRWPTSFRRCSISQLKRSWRATTKARWCWWSCQLKTTWRLCSRRSRSSLNRPGLKLWVSISGPQSRMLLRQRRTGRRCSWSRRLCWWGFWSWRKSI